MRELLCWSNSGGYKFLMGNLYPRDQQGWPTCESTATPLSDSLGPSISVQSGRPLWRKCRRDVQVVVHFTAIPGWISFGLNGVIPPWHEGEALRNLL